MLRPAEWLAADTESRILIDGRPATQKEVDALSSLPVADIRRRASVDVYKWLLSDGYTTETFTDFYQFIDAIAQSNAAAVWWYNAKYDFSNVDFRIISDGWKEAKQDQTRKPNTYESLHSDKGQRYCYTLTYNFKGHGRQKDRHTRTHRVRFYDLCNIFGGGLAAVLSGLKVVDFDGAPIRKKKTENYQEGTADDYDDADARGLFHAVRIADAFTSEKFGLHLAGKRPDAMTAGGLAKKVMLEYLEKTGNAKSNVREFKRAHPMTPAMDAFFRDIQLYRGGLVLLNPRFVGQFCAGLPMFRYDRNSMYPAEMEKMPNLYGRPFKVLPRDIDKYRNSDRFEVIAVLDWYEAHLRPGFIPVLKDPVTDEMAETVEYRGPGAAFFLDELEELKNWYDFSVDNIVYYIVMCAKPWPEMAEFCRDAYAIKQRGRVEENAIMAQFGKLLCNSSYGKFAQNPNHRRTRYIMNEDAGAVRLEVLEDADGVEVVDTDEDGLLSVVLGAKVTSLARCALMREAVKVCHGRPADYLIYGDTDSLHTLLPHPSPDKTKSLGGWKFEGEFHAWKYLAPKTYIDIDDEGVPEIHSKGVTPRDLEKCLTVGGKNIADGDRLKTWDEIDAFFRPGSRVVCLMGLNLPGGKGLIPHEKYIAKPAAGLPDMAITQQAGEVEMFEA